MAQHSWYVVQAKCLVLEKVKANQLTDQNDSELKCRSWEDENEKAISEQTLPETELVPKSYCCENVILQTLTFLPGIILLSFLLCLLSHGPFPALPPILTSMTAGHVNTPFK